VSTIAEVSAKLRQMQDKARLAVIAAAVDMGIDASVEVQVEELSRKTHPLGTPTPSKPGEPPALITGALRGSVYPEPVTAGGLRASVIIGGHVIYARIHELGGMAGYEHKSHLPPRPYLRPGVIRFIATGEARKAAVRGWLGVMR
jgi:phage gpG-like protein